MRGAQEENFKTTIKIAISYTSFVGNPLSTKHRIVFQEYLPVCGF